MYYYIYVLLNSFVCHLTVSWPVFLDSISCVLTDVLQIKYCLYFPDNDTKTEMLNLIVQCPITSKWKSQSSNPSHFSIANFYLFMSFVLQIFCSMCEFIKMGFLPMDGLTRSNIWIFILVFHIAFTLFALQILNKRFSDVLTCLLLNIPHCRLSSVLSLHEKKWAKCNHKVWLGLWLCLPTYFSIYL